MISGNEGGGNPYDYEDTPAYAARQAYDRDIEESMVEKELEALANKADETADIMELF